MCLMRPTARCSRFSSGPSGLSSTPARRCSEVQQDIAKRKQALLKDLLAVGNKEKTRLSPLLTEALVVEGRHDRLASSGGGDQKVAMTVESASLRIQLFENFGLIGPRCHIKEGPSTSDRIGLISRGRKGLAFVFLE